MRRTSADAQFGLRGPVITETAPPRRTLATLVDEFPEKSGGDVHAWLVDEWRGRRS